MRPNAANSQFRLLDDEANTLPSRRSAKSDGGPRRLPVAGACAVNEACKKERSDPVLNLNPIFESERECGSKDPKKLREMEPACSPARPVCAGGGRHNAHIRRRRRQILNRSGRRDVHNKFMKRLRWFPKAHPVILVPIVTTARALGTAAADQLLPANRL